MGPPFPFIVGAGRSGTTLLRAMLEGNPDIAIAEESVFLMTMGERRQRYESPSGFAADRFLADLVTQRWVQRERIPTELLRGRVEEGRPANFGDAVRLVFAAFAEHRGRPRAGDKTPAYVLALRPLAELLPESRFVHVIRDGRDVALSSIDRPRGPESIPEAALFWRRRILSGRAAGRVLGAERYLEVRYEELVDAPERQLRTVCRLIGLDFREEMLRFYERADQVVAATNPRQHEHLFHPVRKGLRDWRTQMPGEEIAMFESLAGDVLDELGYERMFRRTPMRARVGAWRWRLSDPDARRLRRWRARERATE